MTDTTYNVMKPDKGVPIKAWTKGVPLEDAARQQLAERRAVAVHLQVGGGHAGRALGHRRDGGQRDSNARRDHSGGGRCGYWLRHDGRADFSARQPSAGQSARHPHGD